MYAQVEKPKENESRAVANFVGLKTSNMKQDFEFVDNRIEKITQRKLKDVVNNNHVSISIPVVAQMNFDIDRIKAFGKLQKENFQGDSKSYPGLTVVQDDFEDSKDEVKASKGEEFRTNFLNHYSKNIAVMDENYRRKDHDFYASDVFFHQFSSALEGKNLGDKIEVENIPNEPPQIIKRSRIQNSGTIKFLESFFDVDGEQTQLFEGSILQALLLTPNGSSTNSIVKDYNGLNAQRNKGPANISIIKAMVTRTANDETASWDISFILHWSE